MRRREIIEKLNRSARCRLHAEQLEAALDAALAAEAEAVAIRKQVEAHYFAAEERAAEAWDEAAEALKDHGRAVVIENIHYFYSTDAGVVAAPSGFYGRQTVPYLTGVA